MRKFERETIHEITKNIENQLTETLKRSNEIAYYDGQDAERDEFENGIAKIIKAVWQPFFEDPTKQMLQTCLSISESIAIVASDNALDLESDLDEFNYIASNVDIKNTNTYDNLLDNINELLDQRDIEPIQREDD